jgi:hypothetical protein
MATRMVSSRASGASVGIYYPYTGPGFGAEMVDPDARSLRSLVRDDIVLLIEQH